MELLESIQKSLIEQNQTQGRTLCPSTNRSYISDALWWDDTKEGYLFWYILHYSYHLYGTYDYLAIIKLYNLYGDEVFKLRIYPDYTLYNVEKNTLTTEAYEKIYEEIERNSHLRRKLIESKPDKLFIKSKMAFLTRITDWFLDS